jgi:hypothetical protein
MFHSFFFVVMRIWNPSNTSNNISYSQPNTLSSVTNKTCQAQSIIAL